MTDGDEPRPPSVLPARFRLDELLVELQGRVGAVIGVRDRMHRLLEAVVSVGSNLDLEEVLDRIVRTAVELVDAGYAALGVLDEDGEHLAQFVYHGVDDERAAELRDLTAHPESYGYSPERGVLGVPIRVHGNVFGNLYLTEKRDGGEFDDSDEALLTALASAAGIAVDNARLYETAQLGEAWRTASSEVVSSLLSGTGTDQVLALIAGQARDLAKAVQAVVLLPDTGGETLRVVAVAGADSPKLDGLAVPIAGTGGGFVYTTGLVRRIDTKPHPVPGELANHVDMGPRVVVPLGEPGQTRGVLVVYRRENEAPFGPVLPEMLTAFAAQTALAIELSERRRDEALLSVYDDRDRIARNLHDHVIQRLFAVGMSIQSVTRMVTMDASTAVNRLGAAVDDIDATIREIRSTIFALQQHTEPEHGLRARLIGVVREQGNALGFEPSVTFHGLVDTAVPEEVGYHAVAVLREALANVAKHAKARSATVHLAADDQLVLEVTDDGVGLPPDGRRSGLANLAERAASLGGSLSAVGDERGTRLRWQVPL